MHKIRITESKEVLNKIHLFACNEELWALLASYAIPGNYLYVHRFLSEGQSGRDSLQKARGGARKSERKALNAERQTSCCSGN